MCAAMVQEWHEGRAPDAEGLHGNPSIWTIEDWAKVLVPCVEEDGDYTFDSDSVKVIHAEQKTFAQLIKKPISPKNEYRTTEYRDRMCRNVAVVLIQILQT